MKNVVEDVQVKGSNCINITVEPTLENAKVIAESTTNDFLNQFSDEPLNIDPEKAKAKINGFINYLQSDKFKKKVNTDAYRLGVSPRAIAQGFIGKSVGTLGDVLGIAVDTVHATLDGLLNLLYTVLQKSIDIIMNAVKGLTRIVTLNKTAVA